MPLLCDTPKKFQERNFQRRFKKEIPHCVRVRKNPIFTLKSVFDSKNRFFTLPDAKRGNSMKIFFLKSNME